MLNTYVQTISIERLRKRSFSAPYFGVFLCLRGTAHIILGSRSYDLRPGTLCLYTPGLLLQVLEGSEDLDGIVKVGNMNQYFQVASLVSARDQLRIREASCVEISERQRDRFCQINQLIDSLQEQELHEGDGRDPEGSLEKLQDRQLQNILMVFCLEILCSYFSNTSYREDSQSKGGMVFTRFMEDVYKFCHKERTVQFYANRQGFSPYYFSTLIKAESGRTALVWIQDVTMHVARGYLEDPSLSIKEIADRLGFQDQSLFGRFFKKHEGVSPVRFRHSL